MPRVEIAEIPHPLLLRRDAISTKIYGLFAFRSHMFIFTFLSSLRGKTNLIFNILLERNFYN